MKRKYQEDKRKKKCFSPLFPLCGWSGTCWCRGFWWTSASWLYPWRHKWQSRGGSCAAGRRRICRTPAWCPSRRVLSGRCSRCSPPSCTAARCHGRARPSPGSGGGGGERGWSFKGVYQRKTIAFGTPWWMQGKFWFIGQIFYAISEGRVKKINKTKTTIHFMLIISAFVILVCTSYFI